ncbi:hypothetical protein BTO28_11255 [Domibacillus epiphyticus]|uniref:Uncharacterized protein n=1 Tax=Domibacillus epiphyticus TaxID=1714355 RepID=A0A1V2A6P9_9BACI|nr:hypothetical protein BTO28_11255 [Domibacillus epiphyticus]
MTPIWRIKWIFSIHFLLSSGSTELYKKFLENEINRPEYFILGRIPQLIGRKKFFPALSHIFPAFTSKIRPTGHRIRP